MATDTSAFIPFSVSLGSNPLLLIIINQGVCRLRQGFTQTRPDFLAGSVSAEHRRCLGPQFNSPACWDLRKGFVPSGPPAAAAALVSPVSPPHFPGQQTLVRGDPPPLPLALSVSESLPLLVYISVPGKGNSFRGEV